MSPTTTDLRDAAGARNSDDPDEREGTGLWSTWEQHHARLCRSVARRAGRAVGDHDVHDAACDALLRLERTRAAGREVPEPSAWLAVVAWSRDVGSRRPLNAVAAPGSAAAVPPPGARDPIVRSDRRSAARADQRCGADHWMHLQSTESKIGPYALQDFVLFHVLRYGFRPTKIGFLASHA